jgi:hypothetical protein
MWGGLATLGGEEKLGELRLVSMKSLDSYLNEVFLGLFE